MTKARDLANGDNRFVNTAGDTMTGNLTVPTATISAMTSGAGYIGEVIFARSTTTQVGGASANAIGNSSITLTPGTWLVQALASIFMSVNTDAVSCGIWNTTSYSEVSGSRGNCGTASTTVAQGVVSMQMVITVTSNTVYAPLLCRNGASTLQTTASAGSAANAITALRIR
jgi:hypothetical protein